MTKHSFLKIELKNFTFLFGSYNRPYLQYVNSIQISGLIKDADLIVKMKQKVSKFVYEMQNIFIILAPHLIENIT